MKSSFLWFAYVIGCHSALAQLAVPDAPPSNPVRIPPKSLEFGFSTGKTYRFVSRTDMRMQLPGHGIREMSLEQQARYEATIRDGGKAGVKLRGRTERLMVEVRTGDRLLSYDSLKPEDKETRMGKHFRTSLGDWVDLLFNKDNRVVSSDTGRRVALAELAEPISEMPLFGPEELEHLAATLPQAIPDGPVAPGDTWKIEGARSIDGVGDLQFDVVYRYEGPVTHEGYACDQIVSSGQLSGDTSVPGPGGLPGGGRMLLRNASLRGKVIFDPVINTIRYSEEKFTVLIELPAPEGTAPTEIPIEQSSSVRLLHVIDTPGQG